MKCSFIVKPRYISYFAYEMHWPLTLKFRCFVIFVLDLGLDSKTTVLLIFIYILLALSPVVTNFKSWLMCFFFFRAVTYN